MKNIRLIQYTLIAFLLFSAGGCTLFKETVRSENRAIPSTYAQSLDTANTARIVWRNFFTDRNLIALIDTALAKNQELNIMQQEIEIARNEIRSRKGELLPALGIKGGAGADKSGRYTWNGQSEHEWEKTEREPKYTGDFMTAASFSWEIDIWKKLRNNRKAAVARYLASIEGKNFMVTNLISEIANSYYELIALDNELEIIKKNIDIQQSALNIVKQQKEAARVTQLAVNRFAAQLLNTQTRQYEIQQQIIETENKINFLTGRFPVPVERNTASFNTPVFDSVYAGIPVQLLENRPDIRQAELEIAAAKLDVKAARAQFFPSLGISAAAGYQAFNPSVWFNPASFLYTAMADLAGPLINRNAIVAAYKNAGHKQLQVVHKYEQTVLQAFNEVKNQLSGVENYTRSYATKSEEVNLLTQSIGISDNLFTSARADYGEVLLTQREALESKMELIEIRKKLLNAEINVYKALGGGWR